MKRPAYKDALFWILLNDRPDCFEDDRGYISVCLVADIFQVSTEKVLNDLKRLDEKRQNDETNTPH